jgi:hypothetical protein
MNDGEVNGTVYCECEPVSLHSRGFPTVIAPPHCDTSGSHGSEYEDDSCLGCSAV